MTLKILVSKETLNPTQEEQSLILELSKFDIDCQLIDWVHFTPHKTDHVLIRTIWDYTEKPNQFIQLLDQLERSQCRCVNPVSTLRWNMEKSYLLDLAEAGIKIPKTQIIEGFDPHSFLPPTKPFVIKPAIGASGINTLLSSQKNFDSKLKNLLGHKVLIQEFIPEIKSIGEISLIYFDGRYNHAVIKTPKTNEFRIQEEHGGTTRPYFPELQILNTINDWVQLLPVKHLYCRIDIVSTKNGIVLMEAELIEPALYFSHTKPESVQQFAKVIFANMTSPIPVA